MCALLDQGNLVGLGSLGLRWRRFPWADLNTCQTIASTRDHQHRAGGATPDPVQAGGPNFVPVQQPRRYFSGPE
jgi:hypothetical protein